MYNGVCTFVHQGWTWGADQGVEGEKAPSRASVKYTSTGNDLSRNLVPSFPFTRLGKGASQRSRLVAKTALPPPAGQKRDDDDDDDDDNAKRLVAPWSWVILSHAPLFFLLIFWGRYLFYHPSPLSPLPRYTS